MNYTVTCNCGQSLPVRAGDAGTRKVCSCGDGIQVPSLSVLRSSAPPATAGERPGIDLVAATVFGLTVVLAWGLTSVSWSLLVPLGLLVVAWGRCWLAAQILREMALPNALMVLVVPLMPTVFLVQRFDIAWKPFLYGVMGFLMLIVGIAESPW